MIRSGYKITIVIFYFSGTGNTWWVSRRLVEKLAQNGISCKLHSIESEYVKAKGFIEKEIAEADMVGIAYPIYGSDYPEIMRDFIQELPTIEGKKAFVYTTMLLFSGDGAMVAARKLKRKGYEVRQAVNIRMPNNIKLPYIIIRRFPIKNGKEIEVRKEKAEQKVSKLAHRITIDQKWIQGNDPFNVLGGLMQRLPVKLIGYSFIAKHFNVDMDACIECMQCVDFCPTENIRFQYGRFDFDDKCIGCMRCYNLCPEDAIQHKKATLKKYKYPRYKGPGNGFNITKLKD